MKLKRENVFVLSAIIGILAIAFIPLGGSSLASGIVTAAYSVIENSGSALTQRSILDFTGSGISCADDGTNKRTVCTVSGSSGSFGGVNVQTSNYTLQNSDSGLLVVMNCSGACAATLNGSPTSSQTYAIVSIGSTLATVSLNSLNYDGTTSVPTLTTGQILYFASNGSNYFGNMPLIASTNVTFSAANNNIAVSASGGGSGGGASYGAFSSIATCNSGASGDSYGATDIPLFAFCNGTSWAYWVFGRPVQLPSAASFTSQSCSTGCTLTTNGIAYMNIATNNTNPNLHGRYISLPSTPFTVDACFTADFLQANYNGFGIYQSDGTKWQTWYVSALNTASAPYLSLAVNNYSSNTAFASAQLSGNSWFNGAGQVCLRWHDDGTNIEVYTSLTGSNAVAYSSTDPNWTEYGSFSRTSYLTPSQIGWFGDVEQTTRGGTVTLFHWYSH